MNLNSQRDYKKALQARLKELRGSRPDLTLKKLAAKIPIQYTYLSKVMNDPDVHLNEDDLFQAAQVLEFLPAETDLLLLLRAYQTAKLPSRREFLERKLDGARKRLESGAEVQDFNFSRLTQEMGFLFDPLCVLVSVALHIPSVRRDPRVLCAPFGISTARLREILRKMELVDMVALGPGGLTVTELKKNRLHYSREHPLMRVHQQLLRTAFADRLMKTAEEDKECFQVTFSADRGALEEVRGEFKKFLGEVEKIATRSPSRHLYQMTFDLGLWF